MNRQLIAFLSLFSLVLVLSIYYVLVPTDVADTNIPVNVTYEQTRSAYFTSLVLNHETSSQQILDNLSLVVASPEATSEDKIAASSEIDDRLNIIAMENELTLMIKEAGFEEVFVRILDTNVEVVASNSIGLDSIDVAKIMRMALTLVGGQSVVVIDYDNPPPSYN